MLRLELWFGRILGSAPVFFKKQQTTNSGVYSFIKINLLPEFIYLSKFIYYRSVFRLFIHEIFFDLEDPDNELCWQYKMMTYAALINVDRLGSDSQTVVRVPRVMRQVFPGNT